MLWLSRTEAKLSRRRMLSNPEDGQSGTRNLLGFRLYAGRGPTPADANPSTRGLIWIRAHTA